MGIVTDVLRGGTSLAEAVSPIIQGIDPVASGGEILKEKAQMPRILGVAMKIENRKGLGALRRKGVERQPGTVPGGKKSYISVLFVGSCGGVEDEHVPPQKASHEKGKVEPSRENSEKGKNSQYHD
jgi:hypothetical protein